MYDYYSEIRNGIRDYIDCNVDFSEYSDVREFEEKLYDSLFCEDSVTGNGSKSYTFNRYLAEEYVAHNMRLLEDALRDFGYTESAGAYLYDKGAEAADVTIRCYMLGSALHDVAREYEEEFWEED